MDLIPGLPNDVAIECLISIPFARLSDIGSVCKRWKSEIELPEFLQLRKSTGKTQSVVVLSRARHNPIRDSHGSKCCKVPVYHLVVFEPETGCWSDLPTLPEFSNGLPMFCHLVAVGSDLVVMGGYDPQTWEVLDSVFIFNFVTSTWRRGASIPGGPRSFFGCVSDSHRTVFIAGGHDIEKIALNSAWAYYVAKNYWVPLPDMERERDECKGAFHRGMFHVIGGYPTEMQGQFEKSAEHLDPSTWQWGQVEDEFLNLTKCPRSCIGAFDEKLYMCRGSEVIARENATWEMKAKLSADVCNTVYLTTWQEKLLVIGCLNYGEPHNAYVMDMKKQTWTKVEVPEAYSGQVQSVCCLEI